MPSSPPSKASKKKVTAMRADNSAALIEAARRRHDAALARAADALRRIDQAGTPVSFQAVAIEAAVSRSWLYRQPALRTEIERLRAEHGHSQFLLPARLRASDESVRARREALEAEIVRLTEENRWLTRQAELLLGERRAAGPPTSRGLVERMSTTQNP